MSHAPAGEHLLFLKNRPWLGGQQIRQTESSRRHRQRPVGVARPLGCGAIPVEFNAVLVRIAQIERFPDAVIRRAIEGDASGQKPAQRVAACV